MVILYTSETVFANFLRKLPENTIEIFDFITFTEEM